MRVSQPVPATPRPPSGNAARRRAVVVTGLVWLAVASVFVGQNIVANRPFTASMPWMRVLWFELEYWLVFALATPLLWTVTSRYSFERGRRRESVIAHTIVGLAFAAVQPALADALNYLTVLAVGGAADPRLARVLGGSLHGYPVLVIIALWKYVIIVCICFGLAYYRRYRDQEVRAVRLREDLANAELRTLQMQLHPHFLFNALNSAAVLTTLDPPRAHAVLVQLADLLRATVGGDLPLQVPLSTEIELLDRYLAIERVRFDDRLDVRFEVPSDVEDELVPSLILQPLVENAIRHGFAATAGVHHLIVRARGDGASLVIEVEDDGSGLAKDWSLASARTGLSNAQARVDLANGRHEPVELLRRPGGGSIVRFRLPRAAAAAVSAA